MDWSAGEEDFNPFENASSLSEPVRRKGLNEGRMMTSRTRCNAHAPSVVPCCSVYLPAATRADITYSHCDMVTLVMYFTTPSKKGNVCVPADVFRLLRSLPICWPTMASQCTRDMYIPPITYCVTTYREYYTFFHNHCQVEVNRGKWYDTPYGCEAFGRSRPASTAAGPGPLSRHQAG
jgi:hypothetical protein